MARQQRPCSVEECNRPVLAKALCGMHYQRQLKYGDPQAAVPPSTPSGTRIKWLLAHSEYSSTNCLIWPFGRTTGGYGSAQLDGQNMQAHRAMCILAHGEPPTDKHEAAHSCGRGGDGCVNPAHLRWATSKENHADRVTHGTSNRGEKQWRAKLDEATVLDIRRNQVAVPPALAAKKYGVSLGAIYDIYDRRTWAWLSEA